VSESVAPPASGGGGNLKYGIVGVVLIVAAIAVWFGMRGCEEGPPGPVATPDAGTVDRNEALADDDLYIPEPEPDAGPEEDAGPPRIRYVTRYVGGGGDWSCSGEIDATAARNTLSQYNLQFRNCYERRLKVNNTLEGRVNLQMRVGRNGRVDAVRTGGSLNDAQVLSCVRGIAQRITFTVPSGGGCAVVAAPFNFTPRP
jgi:hypothetical protein